MRADPKSLRLVVPSTIGRATWPLPKLVKRYSARSEIALVRLGFETGADETAPVGPSANRFLL